MPVFADRGIIWKSEVRGENDALLTVLSREQGKIDLIAKGLRGKNSKRRGTIQPFALIDFTPTKPRLAHQSGILTHSEFLFAPALHDPVVFAELALAAELSARTLPWGEALPAVFALWEEFIRLPFQKPLVELCGFLVQFSTHLGLFPDVRHCCRCGRLFSEQKTIFWETGTGISCCRSNEPLPVEGVRLSFDQLKTLFFLRSASFSQIQKLSLRNDEATELLNLLFREIRRDDDRAFPARQVFESVLRK